YRAANELGRREDRESARCIGDLGAGDVDEPARNVRVVGAADDRDTEAWSESLGELAIVRPSFRAPDAAGCEGDDRAIGAGCAQQRVYGAPVVIAWEESRRGRGGGTAGESEEPHGVVVSGASTNALGVEQATSGVIEAGARRDACERGERGGAKRALGEIGVRIARVFIALAPRGADAGRGSREAGRAAVGARLVEDDDLPNGWVVRQQRRRRARGDHVHRAASGELGDQRRGEHRIAEERSLDDEGGGHRWAEITPPAAPPGTPPAESRPSRPASSASFLPSASRGACACASRRRRSTWRARSCAAVSPWCAQ